MNPNSPKTEENLFKTANEELDEETKKEEPQQRSKPRVFDAYSDPVPLSSPTHQHKTNLSMTDLAPVITAAVNSNELMMVTHAIDREKSNNTITQSQFVDVMQESQFSLAQGSRAFITRNLVSKGKIVNLSALNVIKNHF